MQRWGTTASGKTRFRCRRCKTSRIRRRPDHAHRCWQRAFADWLVSGLSLTEIARRHGVGFSTLRHHFRDHWSPAPQPVIPGGVQGIILDGTSVMKRHRVLLVVQDVRRYPVTWAFAERETYDSWRGVLESLRASGIQPRFIVCDGHTGLLKALRKIWPEVLVQRCVVHVTRQARLDLTQHPKTDAGVNLLRLVKKLSSIRTRRQRRRWLRTYRQWLRRHDAFLKERTQNPAGRRRWWYTHRKLRAVRSLLSNSLPDLFHYVRYPEIPRTTNHVEGGINSRIKDLYRRHRGLSLERKTILTAHYLASRQTPKKPTRNEH